MTWIKISGITNLEDAQAAVEAGADAIGFHFGDGAREIQPERAATIAAKLPAAIEKVGVFAMEKPERIHEIVTLAGLTAVQLLGYPPEFAERFFAANVAGRPRLYFTLSLPTIFSAATATASMSGKHASLFDAIVVDAGPTGSPGAGESSRTFDWDRTRPFIAGLKKNGKIIVAGGLTPENVGRALEVFEPWGVDVDTGVDSQPGKKDHHKMQAFVRAVRKSKAPKAERR